MPFKEKRQHPRVVESILCRVTSGAGSFETQTKNLSCGGALCRLSIPLVPMTRLEIALELPAGPLALEGVVVRQEPDASFPGKAAYWTAIYFSHLQSEARRRIAEFVLQSMLSHDHRGP